MKLPELTIDEQGIEILNAEDEFTAVTLTTYDDTGFMAYTTLGEAAVVELRDWLSKWLEKQQVPA